MVQYQICLDRVVWKYIYSLHMDHHSYNCRKAKTFGKQSKKKKREKLWLGGQAMQKFPDVDNYKITEHVRSHVSHWDLPFTPSFLKPANESLYHTFPKLFSSFNAQNHRPILSKKLVNRSDLNMRIGEHLNR